MSDVISEAISGCTTLDEALLQVERLNVRAGMLEISGTNLKGFIVIVRAAVSAAFVEQRALQGPAALQAMKEAQPLTFSFVPANESTAGQPGKAPPPEPLLAPPPNEPVSPPEIKAPEPVPPKQTPLSESASRQQLDFAPAPASVPQPAAGTSNHLPMPVLLLLPLSFLVVVAAAVQAPEKIRSTALSEPCMQLMHKDTQMLLMKELRKQACQLQVQH